MKNDSTIPSRVDAEGILKKALGELQAVPDQLVDALLAELSKPDTDRAQRIQDALKRAAHDPAD